VGRVAEMAIANRSPSIWNPIILLSKHHERFNKMAPREANGEPCSPDGRFDSLAEYR
jgi:hypothetical protein